jgi:hypothetical protein
MLPTCQRALAINPKNELARDEPAKLAATPCVEHGSLVISPRLHITELGRRLQIVEVTYRLNQMVVQTMP